MANDTTPAPDLIAEALTNFYGERCPDFEPGCHCCEAWAQYDALRGAARPLPDVKLETTEEECTAYAKAAGSEFVWPESGFVGRVIRDRYTLLARVSALEAERDAAVERLTALESSYAERFAAVRERWGKVAGEHVDLATRRFRETLERIAEARMPGEARRIASAALAKEEGGE